MYYDVWKPCVYVDTLIYMHIFTQRQKRTSQGLNHLTLVFLSSRNQLRLEAQASLSSLPTMENSGSPLLKKPLK